MTIFFDNNFSKKIVETLKNAGHDATHSQEHFPPRTPDTTWIPDIGKRGWQALTLDKNIRKRPAERLALKEANLTAVFFHQDYFLKDPTEQRDWIIYRWSIIRDTVTQCPPGTHFRLTMDGAFTLLDAEPEDLP